MDLKNLSGWVRVPGDGNKGTPHLRSDGAGNRHVFYAFVKDGKITGGACHSSGVLEDRIKVWNPNIRHGTDEIAKERWEGSLEEIFAAAKPDGWYALPGDGLNKNAPGARRLGPSDNDLFYYWYVGYKHGIPMRISPRSVGYGQMPADELARMVERDPVAEEYENGAKNYIEGCESLFGKTIPQIFAEHDKLKQASSPPAPAVLTQVEPEREAKPINLLDGWYRVPGHIDAGTNIYNAKAKMDASDDDPRFFWAYISNSKVIGLRSYSDSNGPSLRLPDEVDQKYLKQCEKHWGIKADEIINASLPSQLRELKLPNGWIEIPGEKRSLQFIDTKNKYNFYAYVYNGRVVGIRPEEFGISKDHVPNWSDLHFLELARKEWNLDPSRLIERKIIKDKQEEINKHLEVDLPDGFYRLPGKDGKATRSHGNGNYYWWVRVYDKKIVAANGWENASFVPATITSSPDTYIEALGDCKLNEVLLEKEPTLPIADGWYALDKDPSRGQAAALVIDGKVVGADRWANREQFDTFAASYGVGTEKEKLSATVSSGRMAYISSVKQNGKSAQQQLAEKHGFACKFVPAQVQDKKSETPAAVLTKDDFITMKATLTAEAPAPKPTLEEVKLPVLTAVKAEEKPESVVSEVSKTNEQTGSGLGAAAGFAFLTMMGLGALKTITKKTPVVQKNQEQKKQELAEPAVARK